MSGQPLKRYDMVTNYRCGESIDELEPSDDGEWMRFEDHERLLSAQLAATHAAHQEELVSQRVIGHGEGQEHAIADVNAGRVDDLIAPRLAVAQEVLRAMERFWGVKCSRMFDALGVHQIDDAIAKIQQLAATHAAIRALRDEWLRDAAFNPRETSPGYSCGLEKCAKALEAISATHVAVPRVAPSEDKSGQLVAAIRGLPHYAQDHDGSMYGPVDPGEGTFVRSEDIAALLETS